MALKVVNDVLALINYGFSIITDTNGTILVSGARYNGTDYDMAIWRYIPLTIKGRRDTPAALSPLCPARDNSPPWTKELKKMPEDYIQPRIYADKYRLRKKYGIVKYVEIFKVFIFYFQHVRVLPTIQI